MKYDIAIVGSGFGGSLCAMIARQLGLSVIMLEKDRHPRFVIGESTTPLTDLYLEELTDKYGLKEVHNLTKYGRWKRSYPDVNVGLKRGFSFFHHEAGKPFQDGEKHRNQLLVAANPNSELGDTQWYRPEFDQLLVKIAEDYGVEYHDQTEVKNVRFINNDIEMAIEKAGVKKNVNAGFLIDASGPNGFLHHNLDLPGGNKFPNIPDRESLFTHFKNVGMTMDWINPDEKDNLPYHPDHAAIHLLFDGGWIWLLRFDNGIVSAGVSLDKKIAREIKLEEGKSAWSRLISRFPSIDDLFKEAEAVYPFQHMPSMSYRCDKISGKKWVMLPAASAFIDPMMSTGFPLNLRGIMRIGKILEHIKEPAKREELLNSYSVETKKDQQVGARMIAALLRHLADFELFSALSMLYFAAASYSESAIRLKKPELASSFLLDENPEIGPVFRQCYQKALTINTEKEKKSLIDEIYRSIQSIDVAGLSDTQRNHWYPVKAKDLLENAGKLNATKNEIIDYMKRTGFPVGSD
ncbi:MAG TPA: hypothetical protein VKA34_14335 [Balneolales bacterium]|nr:hypothetical protein [Balneolales bacterium]